MTKKNGSSPKAAAVNDSVSPERVAAVGRVFADIRFATTAMLKAILVPDPFPSPDAVRLCLPRLERQGVLDRPAEFRSVDRASHFVLAGAERRRGRPLDIWGAGKSAPNVPQGNADQRRNNRRLKPGSFEHPLMISHLYTTLRVADQQRLVTLDRWVPENAFQTTVNVEYETLPVQPDATIELTDLEDGDRYVFAYVECDTATEPYTRSDLEGSSFLKKALAYQALWQQVFRPKEDPLLVLIITKTARAAAALAAVPAMIDPRRRGLDFFWFTSIDRWNFTDPQGFLRGPIWTTPSGEERSLLPAHAQVVHKPSGRA